MTPEGWQQIKELFYAALELPPGEREAFLREACGSDSVQHEELTRLFASHEQANSFIEAPALQPVSEMIAAEQASRVGQRIGPYQILQELGQGGMGAVYLAERADQQYQKRVAIKLVRRGLDHNFIVQRFLSERQILAQLDHPNIARLLDGGTTEDGLPYLVMDYIEGLPIDRYCDGHQLSTAERLKLFRTICSAVQYAHQNLVIHRDIKPSNILVTADGTAKLLDFGIAKLLSPEPAIQIQEQTATALRLMTPEYASPEQVRGEVITTASDIYSLGVLLYKLLVGHLPYRLKLQLPHEIERAICEEEPEKPSIAVAERMKDEGGRMKGRRAFFHPSSFIPHPSALRGDLDNILLKAIRKGPQRRYASVEQFSEDLRRHLEGLPVSARQDTLAYRAGKFIRRHKVGMAAAALVVLMLCAGVGAVLWQAGKARIAAQKAERVSAFLQQLLASADENWYVEGKAKGPDVTVKEVLDEASQRIESELHDQPEVKADLHHTIGNTYRALGFQDAAKHHFEAALKLRRAVFGEQHVKVAESLYYLAAAAADSNSRLELLRQAVTIQRRWPAEGNNLPYMLHELAGELRGRRDYAAAESLFREALELTRQRYAGRHMLIPMLQHDLGMTHEERGEFNQAEPLYKTSAELYDQLPGRPYSQKATPLISLGRIRMLSGEYAEAERLLAEGAQAIRLGKQISSPARESLEQDLLLNLGELWLRKGDYARAEAEIRHALKLINRLASYRRSILLSKALTTLGLILARAGRPALGEVHLREALELRKRCLPEGDWQVAQTSGALGECLAAQRRYAEAESLLLGSYRGLQSSQGEQHPRTIEARRRLVTLYEGWGKPEQAAHFRAQLAPPQP